MAKEGNARTSLPSRRSLPTLNPCTLHTSIWQTCRYARQQTYMLVLSVIVLFTHWKRNWHSISRTITNLELYLKHIQGKLPPTYNPIWDKGLEFIHDNITPNPASFCSRVFKKVTPALREQLDDVVMGVIYAYVQAVEEFVGTDTHAWNSKANVFLWLLFHVEMLVMGPKCEKSGG